MTFRILIAEDHAVVRQGLQVFLRLDDAFEVIGETSSSQEAVEMTRQLKPVVVLMGLLMPVQSDLEAIPMIEDTAPETEIIALTDILNHGAVVSAVKAGAIGYLLKDTQSDDLLRSIKSVAGQVTAMLAQDVRIPDSPETLTEREVDVLRLIAQGFSNREIADELVLGEKTIKTHVSNILSKLQLASRTQAALYAVRIGLVSIREE